MASYERLRSSKVRYVTVITVLIILSLITLAVTCSLRQLRYPQESNAHRRNCEAS